MKWTVLIILLIIGLIIAIIVSVMIANKPSAHITPSGGGGGGAKVAPNCAPSQDPELLIKCDPGDPDTCKNCSGPSSCYTIDEDHPYYYAHGDAPDQKFKVPDGNWCLPTKTKTMKCNPYTGYHVLVKLSEKENAWVCNCEYPLMFQKAGALGDCTEELACGAQHGDGQLVCPPDAKYCKPGTPWVKDPTWSPTAGVCKCKPGLKYVDRSNPGEGVYIKSCVQDTCYPGNNLGDKCDCSIDGKPYHQNDDGSITSYIRCPDDIVKTKAVPCTKDAPLCLPDPCNPGGYYDPESGECKCLGTGNVPKESETSPTGWVCQNPCDSLHNPCGDRGVCHVVKKDNDYIAKCKDCQIPWHQDKNDLCGFHLRPLGQSCDHDWQCLIGACEKQYIWWGDKVCS